MTLPTITFIIGILLGYFIAGLMVAASRAEEQKDLEQAWRQVDRAWKELAATRWRIEGEN